MEDKKFYGIFPALLTPFDDNGNINASALEKLIERNISQGVNGFYCCGSTAEVFMLTDKQRMELMALCSEIVNGRVTIIAQVGAISTDKSIMFAREAERLGYDAVSAVAPFYYKFNLDEIKDYYLDIASATSLKCLIYNIPTFSGVNMSADYISDFMARDNFLGMKHTSSDFFVLQTVKSRHPDKKMFNGFDEMFLQGLTAGADGGIGSTYNFMADKFIKIQSLFKENKIAEAQAVQSEANMIISKLFEIGINPAHKEILNLLGYDFGHSLPPYHRLTKEKIERLEKEIMPYVAE